MTNCIIVVIGRRIVYQRVALVCCCAVPRVSEEVVTLLAVLFTTVQLNVAITPSPLCRAPPRVALFPSKRQLTKTDTSPLLCTAPPITEHSLFLNIQFINCGFASASKLLIVTAAPEEKPHTFVLFSKVHHEKTGDDEATSTPLAIKLSA